MKLKEEFEKHLDLYRDGHLFDPVNHIFYTDNDDFKKPKGHEDWEVQKIDKKAYLNSRLEEMGVTPEQNQVELLGGVGLQENEKNEHAIFGIDRRGNIEILQYSLDRKPYTFTPLSAENHSTSNREQYNVQIRLAPWDEHICEGKYNFKKAKNVPFWPPLLLQEHEAGKDQKKFKTLVVTEGQIKAMTGAAHNIPICGLTSISHFRDSTTGELHSEILKYIELNDIERLVVLWDGDCRDISTSAINDRKDLQKRPFLFYHFVLKIRESAAKYVKRKNFRIVFATINSSSLEGNPKGIDNLLNQFPKQRKTIASDLISAGDLPSQFFYTNDITGQSGMKELRSWFKLQNENQFYSFHSEKIGQREFIFNGTTYQIENGKPIIKIEGDLKKYMRVGTDYYRIVSEPQPVGKDGQTETEETLVPWTSSAIVLDHGKGKLPYIQKYLGFTNVASHVNYNQVIDNHYNLYQNIDHKTSEGSWENIEILLKHLFQDQYTMALDYISILYHHPFQKLPVVCLVSKEQKTGKSTFVYLMKLIFKQNMAIISNNDLTSDFNSHWTSKLIVASEETMLEKKDAYEKIKAITTQRTIMRNEKNKTAKEIPCMVHFIFCSNHEDDFIRIDDKDSRLWIRKIKTIEQRIKGFDQKIEDEIPAFVHFIQNRKIEYQDIGERLYFDPEHFKTDAFYNVVKHSEPSIVKEMREQLKELFLTNGDSEIHMVARDLKNEFNLRGEMNYINKCVNQFFKAERFKNAKGEEAASTYKYRVANPGEGSELLERKGRGRYFIFKREQFVTEPAEKTTAQNQK